jgi:hypothetical protein
MAELNGTIAEVRNNIQARLGEIEDELASNIPLWGEYAGAAKINVDKVIESIGLYNEAIAGWAETSNSLVGKIPEGLREQLDQLPVDQRAALTKLSEEQPAEFDKVINAYETSFNLTKDVARTQWKTELPALIEEGNQIVAAKAKTLETSFATIGGNVADAWKEKFRTRALSWVPTVEIAAKNAINAAEDTFVIESPSKVFMRIGDQVGTGFKVGLESSLSGTAAMFQSAIPNLGGLGAGSVPSVAHQLAPSVSSTVVGSRAVNFHVEITNPTTTDLSRDLSKFRGIAESNALLMMDNL